MLIFVAFIEVVTSFEGNAIRYEDNYAMRVDERLHELLSIEELTECLKKHGLNPKSLPNVEDIGAFEKNVIFNSCNPLFNVPIVSLRSKPLSDPIVKHEDGKKKRSLSRTNHRTVSRKHGTDANDIQGSAIDPLEVLVTFDHMDVISEVLRLQFLFLNTFFSSLSGCIESEDVKFSSCLLESFSNAFSVLSIELGQ